MTDDPYTTMIRYTKNCKVIQSSDIHVCSTKDTSVYMYWNKINVNVEIFPLGNIRIFAILP